MPLCPRLGQVRSLRVVEKSEDVYTACPGMGKYSSTRVKKTAEYLMSVMSVGTGNLSLTLQVRIAKKRKLDRGTF